MGMHAGHEIQTHRGCDSGGGHTGARVAADRGGDAREAEVPTRQCPDGQHADARSAEVRAGFGCRDGFDGIWTESI
jgi:hypothetical protein